MSPHTPCVAARAVAGRRLTCRKVQAENRNVSASMAKAAPSTGLPALPPSPCQDSSSAASRGPASRDSWRTAICKPLAFCNAFGGTACGRMAVPAGMPKADAMPSASAATYTSARLAWPSHSSVASSNRMTALAYLLSSITRRGEWRSAMAPPSSIRRARGAPISATAMPRPRLSPVRLSTSQGRASMLNWSPSMETRPPPSSQRKLVLRSKSVSVGMVV